MENWIIHNRNNSYIFSVRYNDKNNKNSAIFQQYSNEKYYADEICIHNVSLKMKQIYNRTN